MSKKNKQKYILLKDLPNAEAGTLVEPLYLDENMGIYSEYGIWDTPDVLLYSWSLLQIQSNPEWFQPASKDYDPQHIFTVSEITNDRYKINAEL